METWEENVEGYRVINLHLNGSDSFVWRASRGSQNLLVRYPITSGLNVTMVAAD